MKPRPFISIVGPFFNEADYIVDTLASLAGQVDDSGKPYDRNTCEILLVDNGSTDRTVQIIKKFAMDHPAMDIKVLTENEKGHIHARITGMRYAIEHREGSHVLVGIDTDTLFPSSWLRSVLRRLDQENAAACGSSGYFTGEMWLRARKLSEYYLKNVGTLFFDPETVEKLGAKGKKYLFTHQIFIDFVRPFSDCAFAIRKEAYLKAGEYTIEYRKDNPSLELLAEGWRLKFQLDRLGEKVSYTDEASFITSPRRFVQDCVGMFNGATYKTMPDYRARLEPTEFDKLDDIADKLDFRDLQAYVVRNYMLLPCLTNPVLLEKNRHYFEGFFDDLRIELTQARESLDWRDSNSIFDVGYALTNKFLDRVLPAVARLGLKG